MQIFELLLGTDASSISGLLLSIRSVYLVGLVAFVGCSLLYIDDDATAIAIAEVVSFAVMFATCPPLLAFTTLQLCSFTSTYVSRVSIVPILEESLYKKSLYDCSTFSDTSRAHSARCCFGFSIA